MPLVAFHVDTSNSDSVSGRIGHFLAELMTVAMECEGLLIESNTAMLTGVASITGHEIQRIGLLSTPNNPWHAVFTLVPRSHVLQHTDAL